MQRGEGPDDVKGASLWEGGGGISIFKSILFSNGVLYFSFI